MNPLRWTARIAVLAFSLVGVMVAFSAFVSARPARAACDPDAPIIPINGTVRTFLASLDAYLAPNGNFVTYQRREANFLQVYLYERQTCTETLISKTPAGAPGNEQSNDSMVSDDGRYVVFQSYATDLLATPRPPCDLLTVCLEIYLYDRTLDTMKLISAPTGVSEFRFSSSPSLSRDGRYIVFQSNESYVAEDDNEFTDDVYLYDVAAETLELLSVNAQGVVGNNSSDSPYISSDGRYVTFKSVADNLVPNDVNDGDDILVLDRQLGALTRASVNTAGVQANGGVSAATISDNGRYVVFTSDADNLDPNDVHVSPLFEAWDVFVRDRQTGITRLAFQSPPWTAGDDGFTSFARMTPNGRYITFDTLTRGLSPADLDERASGYIVDRQTGALNLMPRPANGAPQYVGVSSGIVNTTNDATRALVWTTVPLVPEDTDGEGDYYLLDVTAFAAPDPYPNLIANGDFGSGNIFPWQFFDDLLFEVDAGVLYFARDPGTNPSLLHAINYPMAPGTALELQFDLANFSAERRRLTILLHDQDFTDFQVCTFWQPPDQDFVRYTVVIPTAIAWQFPYVSFYPSTENPPSGVGAYGLDNVELRIAPDQSVRSVQCLDPLLPSS
jgi:Tol biopolymer transport system component